MRKPLLATLAAGLLLVAGCNQSGTSPGYTSSEFNAAWGALSETLATVQTSAAGDPAVSGAFESLAYLGNPVVGPGSLTPSTAASAAALMLNPASLIPQAVVDLPRGGYDYTDPDNPTTFTPTPPYDLAVKWTTTDGATGLVQVDWEDGKPTVYVTNKNDDQVERPQKVRGNVLIDGTEVAGGGLSATWTTCGTAYIDEPRTLGLDIAVNGGQASLGYGLAFDHASDDRIGLSYTNSITATAGSARMSLELTATGTTQRDDRCYTVGFNAEAVTLTAGIQASSASTGESHSAEFSVTLSNAVFDGQQNLTQADVRGYVKVDGTVAVTFDGTLDDLDQPCPGAHVTLHFADGDTTLKDWLTATGQCAAP